MRGGASTRKSAAAMGTTAISRKSPFMNPRNATPAHVPTHALRENDAASAATSAGIISSGHRRSRVNSTRAHAAHSTSISSPE